jgi:pimeloyl-ACP methyl ester carboxylesterase
MFETRVSAWERSRFSAKQIPPGQEYRMLSDSNIEITRCGDDSTSMYVVLHRSTKPSGTTLVFCPPFDDEMIDTYARFARWSKQLATRGISVLRYHPLGTGESDGTRADITLDSLVRDAATAQGLARQQIKDRRVGYFGLRFGATVSILAAAVHPADFLVLWCPVTNLRSYFRELLRSQITASALQGAHRRTTQQMMADLEAGKSVDVVGYELFPDLYRQMTGMQALPDTPPARKVLWLARPIDEAVARPIVERWKARGSQVDLQVIPETVFWENPGSTLPEQFATATVQWLSQLGD